MQKISRLKSPTTALILLSVLALLSAACSSNKITKQSAAHRIESASAAVSQSIVNDARTYAPIELRTAERKLEDARTLAANGDHFMAHLTAHQVELDAQFAEAKAQSQKADKIVLQLQENNRILKEEINRAAATQK